MIWRQVTLLANDSLFLVLRSVCNQAETLPLCVHITLSHHFRSARAVTTKFLVTESLKILGDPRSKHQESMDEEGLPLHSQETFLLVVVMEGRVSLCNGMNPTHKNCVQYLQYQHLWGKNVSCGSNTITYCPPPGLSTMDLQECII